jgi:uncharacterized delta-60 repeat protein
MRRLRENLFVSSWRRVVGLGVLALAALGAGSVLAQPANDNFTSAPLLDFVGIFGSTTGNNVGATREPGEPLIVGNPGGSSVWYKYIPVFDGIVTVDTAGSDFDTILGVYVGTSVDNLHLIAENNNAGGGGTSRVTFSAPAFSTVYIAVDGTNGAQGNIVLNWTEGVQSAAGPNDFVAQATTLTGNSGTIFDLNTFATAEPFESIFFGGLIGGVGTNSMWYKWTAPSDGIVTFDTHGSSFDTILDIYGGANPPPIASSLGENDDFIGRKTSQMSLQVTANTVYWISVNGYRGASGGIQLNWKLGPLPANDNFASATQLDSSLRSSSITDNNLGATAEAGEPNHAGFPAGASVWYKWLAPQDGEVELDTIGSSFDTVLGVYTGTSVATAAQVAANDDLYPTFSLQGVGQAAQFNEMGQMLDNTNVPEVGQLVITNVLPPPPPTTNFPVSQIDYEVEQPFAGLPGVSYNGSGASGLRFNAKAGTVYYFAVSGKSGGAGQFNLNWGFHSSGVFKFASETRDRTSGIPLKTATTIISSGGGVVTTSVGSLSGYPGMLLYQVAETESLGDRGGLEPNWDTTASTIYDFEVGGLLVTITRVGGSSGRVTVGYTTVDGNNIHDHYTYDASIGGLIPDGALLSLNGDTAARNGIDYTGVSGTLTFNDSEVSKTIIIPVRDDGGVPNHNRDFSIVLFNPQRDVNESTNVSQPRLDPVDSQVLVRILDADLDPRGGTRTLVAVTNFDSTLNTNVTTTNLVFSLDSTNAIFNFLKSNYRIPEDASDYWNRNNRNIPITLYVSRSGTNNGAASISYRIDTIYKDNAGGDVNGNIYFPLQPGSDYASPSTASVANVVTRGPQDFTGTASGTLSWGANDGDPKPITFTINNDALTEFNEDFRVQLFDVLPPNTVVPVGTINETTITIMFDDEDPPAGSVDEWYNPDFGLNMITAVTNGAPHSTPVSTEPRQRPGTDAQSQVNALVVQTDDNTIIGGDFITYNGTQRHGIARLLTNGELDPTFNPGDGINIVGGDFISALAVQPDGKILVGGSFTSFNGQPCGNIIRLNTNGTLDDAFRISAGSAANKTVRTLTLNSDGTIYIGGDFTSFNGSTRKYLALLNPDGSLNTSFDPGSALNDAVYALTPQIGAFTMVSALANPGDIGLTNTYNVGSASGSIDVSYDMGNQPDQMQIFYGGPNGVLLYDSGMVTGTNRVVIPFFPTGGVATPLITIVMDGLGGTPGAIWNYTAKLQGTGNSGVTVGGDFTAAGGISGQDHIARFQLNGALDLSFDPGSGANGRVRAILSQANGDVIVGGDFTLLNGQTATHIARLNPDGSLDANFNAGTGTDADVYSLNRDPGGRIISLSQGGLAITNSSTNITFDLIYVGGPFTVYNGTHRLGFARLNNDGSLDTTFLDTAYNEFAGLPRKFWGDRNNAVFASALQSDGMIMIGGSFSQVGGGQFDKNDRDAFDPFEYAEPKQRNGARNRVNVARLIGGATAGPGNIGFVQPSYGATKSQGFIFPLLTRNNGSLGYASANFSVVPGSAKAGLDYFYSAAPPIYPIQWEYFGGPQTRMHSDGLFGTNTVMNDSYGGLWQLGLNGMASVIVSILPNQLVSGNTHAQFQLANPPSADQFFLGGQNMPIGVALGRSSAPFDIADDGRKPGTFGFTSPIYAASANAVISVTRTNGDFNSSPILVDYSTAAGTNTISGVDYIDTTGTLTFNNGETLKSFAVQIVQSNYISAVEKSVNLQLFNFPAGSSTGLTNAVLRLINPNFQGFLNFSSTNYVTNLTAGAVQLTIQRIVGSKGTLDVQVQTTDGTASNGVDYVSSPTILHWDNGDVTSKTVNIPFINNGSVGGSKKFFASLVNPLLNGSPTPSLLGSASNTVVTIVNDNNFGVFQFSKPVYVVNEATNGIANITVVRAGSALGTATLDFATSDGPATAGVNYFATNGTLSFAPGQSIATISVRILQDAATNMLPFYFDITLSNPSAGAFLGSPTVAQVNIVDAESFNRPPGSTDVTFDQQGINSDVLTVGLQTNGMIVAGGNFTGVGGIPRGHVARFHSNGSLDPDFLNGLSGTDGSIYTLLVQTDGRILIGGAFGTVNGVVRNRIARLADDGTLDVSFSPGSGSDGPIFSLAETFQGGSRRVYVGGAFTLFEGASHPGIARLGDNGILDQAWSNTGVNGIVYAIAVYPTNSIYAGKVLIGGSFTTVNGQDQANIARLNADGSIDTNFVANADGIVRALAIQNDNAVVLGGEFSNVNGTAANHIARLNGTGAVDASFASAVVPGLSDNVNAIAIQDDNRIVVVGQFLTANGLTRHHITRLLPSGAPDTTINFGDGANGDINAVAIQPADQFIVIGGGFTQYNGHSAPYLTRLYGGSATGSGKFEFMAPAFEVNEDGVQASITVRRVGGTSGPNPDGSGNVSVQFNTTPGTAVPGVNYTSVSTSVSFPPGEVEEQVFVPVIDDFVITSNKTVNLALSNPSATAGLGDQTNAVLTINNIDSAISFSSPNYQVSETIPTGVATITLTRIGGLNATATVGFATTTNGNAVIGTDYNPTNAVVVFNPGDISKTVNVPVLNNPLPQGDHSVGMAISNILAATIGSPSNAVLTIKDSTFSPGQLQFANTNFFANEGDGTASITVLRTGGSSGSVSAFYYTTPNTAVPGLNYISVSNTVTFSDGQTNRTFTVPLVDNSLAQGILNFNVLLITNASSGTTLGFPSNAQVFITDNDSGFAFVDPTNTVLESASQISVGVLRIGPTNSAMSVNFATHDGTAVAGVNYTASAGTLTFSPGQTLKTVQIPITDDPQVTGDQLFTVVLSTNAASGAVQLAYPSTNTVIIRDADAGLSFTNASIIVRRDIGNAIITVVCSNPSIEPVIIDSNTVPLSVQYATSDGSAVAGVDYISTSGTLVFTNGNGTNTFAVPIINNNSVTGARDFHLRLFNATAPGRIVDPSNEVVTIIDGTAGFKFSKTAYSVNKTAGSAIINVFRTGLTDSLATVDFVATNGSAINGIHYFATNGTLIFTNGVTNQTFSVQVIDTSAVQPNKTVSLELFNPSNSVVGAPSAATLTIRDNTGSFVIPSGAALVSETGAGAPNGVVDPDETITALFALRDAGGLNVGNLSATIVGTNGVAPVPPSQTQVYGPLLSLGHSVSRPFTFTASGTNGQDVTIVFALQDSGTNIGTAVFGYQLGSIVSRFTNGLPVVINDHAIATPYPSSINVSNLAGLVLKATITLTNLSHASPGDIDALLVSPAQQTTLFMAHAGAQNLITNVTLTFDDAASNSLPESGQIISGTNKPSVYKTPVPVFP